jgi:hypothetical protein
MVTLDIPIRLQPKQWKLYEKLTKGKARIIGAGGGRGSAKSGGIDRIALTLMMEQPGITICIVMRTYEQLRKYHIDPLLRTYPQLKDHYLKTSKKLTLPNGSQLDLGYAENYDAVEEFFRSANYKYIFLDQGEQFLELEIREMYKACRWPSGGAKMAISHNMGGVGIQTFRKWFHSKEYQPRENPDNYDFVKFNPWDNVEWVRPALIEDGLTAEEKSICEAHLKADGIPKAQWTEERLLERKYYDIFTDEERMRYAASRGEYTQALDTDEESYRARDWLGSWDAFEGAYFGRVFDRQATMITQAQAEALIQPWDKTGMSTDWGKAHFCVTQWHGVTLVSPKRMWDVLRWQVSKPVNVIVTYREYITNEMTSSQVGAEIAKRTPEVERKDTERYFFSPEQFGERDSDHTVTDEIGDQLRPFGLPAPFPADNERKGGYLLMHALLYNTKMKGQADPLSEIMVRGKAATDTVWLITANCPELLNSIPLLMRDKHDIDDVLKTDKGQARLEQDCGDTARYFIKSWLNPRQTAPIAVQAKELWDRMPSETGDQVQKRAMAMMKFEHDKRSQNRRRASNWVRS